MNGDMHGRNPGPRTRAALLSSRGMAVALLVAIVAVVFALFQFWGNTYAGLDVRRATRSVFVWLVERWGDSSLSFGGNYSHGWLVPLVTLWLVWRRRAELAVEEKGTFPSGLLVVGLALFMHWIGARGELPQISVIGLVVLVFGIPLYLFGWPTARWLLFPSAYLLFAVPLGFFESLTFPLRMVAASAASAFLNGIGIEVVRVGSAIHSPVGEGFHLEVADPCSGIRSLLAMMAVAAAYSHVTQRTTGRRWVLFLCSIPLAVIGNASRIVAVGLVAVGFGTDAAMGVYHDYSGYLFYAVAIGGLLLVDWRMNRGQSLRPAAAGPSAAADAAPPVTWFYPRLSRACLTVLAFLGATVLALIYSVTVEAADRLALPASLPETVGGWVGVDMRYCQNTACMKVFTTEELEGKTNCPSCGSAVDAWASTERQLLPADTVIVRKRYQRAGQMPVSVTLVFSGRGRSSIHRPEICLSGQGFRIDRSAVLPIPLDGRDPLRLMGLDLTYLGPGTGGQEGKLFFAYWFVGGRGEETPYHFVRLARMAWDRIVRNEATRWAYVSVLAAEPGSAQTARREVSSFVRVLYPRLLSPPQ